MWLPDLSIRYGRPGSSLRPIRVAATIVSHAILGRHNSWARLFNPHRLTIFPSAKKVLTENAKVVGHWLGDRVRHPQAR